MDVTYDEILLLVAGVFAFLIVYTYRKDKDSTSYKACMVLGCLIGIATVAVCAIKHSDWATFDIILIAIAGFALVIRPFRDTDFAILFAILAMVLVYFYLGTLTGDLGGLSEGVPRYILTFVIGAVVYMLLNFLQKIAQFFGKVLNCWPVLFILGVICLVEGALLMAGGNTLWDYYQEYKTGEEVILSLAH